MTLPYTLTPPTGPTLGMITLQTDETIEGDFRRLFDPRIRLHLTRVTSGATLSPQMISDMEAALPLAASLLPPAADFDVVSYACTSGSALIGSDKVEELVRDVTGATKVTDPLRAALAAIKAVGIQRVGVISPYVPSVSAPLIETFENANISVVKTGSFGEEVEANVARIDPASLVEATRQIVAGSAGMEAVFLSCTNLRTLDIIGPLEAELGLPVLSSNQTLAWHMAQLADVPLRTAPGRLFSG